MRPTLTFQDFSTEENYLNLINKFAILHVKEDPSGKPYKKVFSDDFQIVYKEVNPLTYEDSYIDLFFFKDYLFPGIEMISKKYSNYMNQELKDPVYVDKEKIKLKAEEQMGRLHKYLEDLTQKQFLNQIIIDILTIQVESVLEYLEKSHIEPNNTISNKIKVNMKKDTLLTLLTILREQKWIDCPYDNEYGILIDSNFVYLDEKDKTYKPIVGSGKVINNIKNGNKSVNRSIKKIRELFQTEKIYNF